MDACRGSGDPIRKWPIENKNKPKQVMRGPSDAKHHPDEGFILVYPTIKGYQVPDDSQDGGNLIRAIYELFQKNQNIKKHDLHKLLKLTQKKVKTLCDGLQCMELASFGLDYDIYLRKAK